MWWSQKQQAALDSAVHAAAHGSPSLLTIDGDPGQGKTALLHDLVRRAEGFHVLSGEGLEETSPQSLALLRTWVEVPDELRGHGAGFAAAQYLRRHIDELAHTGPVLVVVDDLQWVDTDSLEALSWVLRRASGDRLLIAVAQRSRSASIPAVWRRLDADLEPIRLHLTGMEPVEATALARALVPDIPDDLIRRLREHTGGNPLYLRAILSENDLDDLTHIETLPAPNYLAAGVADRRRTLPADAGTLLDAATIMGTGWSPLPLLAELADVQDPEAAVLAVADVDLLLTRGNGARREVRIAHALIHAALYKLIAISLRHHLHLRAADLVTSIPDRLRHRLAADSRYDPNLSADLIAYADDLHGRGHYAEAAFFRLSGSEVTGDADQREQHWLDGLFEYVLARDPDALTPHLGQVAWAVDGVRRVLVEAGALIVQRHWLAACSAPRQCAANLHRPRRQQDPLSGAGSQKLGTHRHRHPRRRRADRPHKCPKLRPAQTPRSFPTSPSPSDRLGWLTPLWLRAGHCPRPRTPRRDL